MFPGNTCSLVRVYLRDVVSRAEPALRDQLVCQLATLQNNSPARERPGPAEKQFNSKFCAASAKSSVQKQI